MNLLEMLAVNEELIGQLYKSYADRLPKLKEFWTELVGEEAQHAAWLRKLGSEAVSGSINVNEKRFSKEAVQSFQKYLNGELSRRRDGGISPVNALSIALGIEESIIEHRYYEVFESDSSELKRTLFDLEAATREHAVRVKKIWSQHK